MDAMDYRHACKIFDETKKISNEDIKYILEAGRKSPSSFGQEPWKFLVIPNPELKAKFDAYLELSELTAGHIFAYTATEAAYSHGLEWLEEAKEYIWHNICLTKEYLEKNIPEIKPMVPEASYLIWLDCRALGLTQKELVSFFVNDAKLALNDGATFGGEDGYMRMNVGCPKKILEQGLANLKQAVEQKFRK